ncbi:hypothetical protein ACMYSQ_006486 [Aspergillus niger]
MQHCSKPCSACSWSTERQEGCRYESNVKIIHATSDRGVWSLGSDLILKERSNQAPNFEAENLRFSRENTSIPVPGVVEDWEEPNGHYFVLTKRIPGVPLSSLWPRMKMDDKERIAKQTADYLMQLGELHSNRMESLGGKPIYSTFLFRRGYYIPHGPLASDDDLWAELEVALEHVPVETRQRLRQRMPSAAPYIFTHGNLTSANIMVENGSLTGILDWEASGYFPVWWEFTCAGIGLGEEDRDWRDLLQEYMPDLSEAREWWLDYWSLTRYPNRNERATALLEHKESINSA